MLSHERIVRAALEVGFDACGVAKVTPLTDDEFPIRRWLASGRHATMTYMERNLEKRLDPRLLLNGAQTVISVCLSYPPPAPGSANDVAAFARVNDYHETIRPMLHLMAQKLGIEAKACCDTVPISDKSWAARAGLGWVGRHSLLITPQWGSWVNLGELVTTEPCDQYDPPQPSRCGGCHLCQQACPNHALADGMLDARRCTAFLTVESLTPTLPSGIDSRGYAYGCDICQLACPHNNPARLKPSRRVLLNPPPTVEELRQRRHKPAKTKPATYDKPRE